LGVGETRVGSPKLVSHERGKTVGKLEGSMGTKWVPLV